jgi:hypothetical protein
VKAKINGVKAKIQDEEDWGPWSRPTLVRRPVYDQLAASPTSSLKEGSPRQVSASHEKSPPRMTSPAPTGAWAQMHSGSPRREHYHRRAWRNDSPRHSSTTAGGHATNSPRQETKCWPDRLRGHLIAIISHSATRKLSPRHSSTLYDAHGPRLRLERGGLVKYSGRLRQAQTTQRRSQASRDEQSHPATRRLPRQSITTQLQCALTHNDVRRDVPATKHCTSFYFPLAPIPLWL